jgi:Xaa-Pro aminopeptidase
MRLFSDWRYLEQELGCSIRERFLMAVRSLDNPKAVTPVLVERDGQRFGLFLHVEKGNVEAARLPHDISTVYYRPYFTFEPSEGPPQVKSTLADAVDAVASGQRRIVLDCNVPMAIAAELASRFTVEMEEVPSCGTVTLRKATCASTVARLGRGRAIAAQVARHLLDASPERDRLFPYLEGCSDARFAALNAVAKKEELAGLIVSSALNMQEIAGVPAGAKHRPLAVIYLPGEEYAWVVEAGRAADGREFTTPEAALRSILPRGEIGVEAEDLALGLARDLGLNERDHKPVDRALRRWRDENALSDLCYYIVATRTTRHAIDAALEFAASAIRRKMPITEMDAYAVYLRSMREFVAAHLPGARVARTLTNFHAGARTIFPANPAPYPIDAAANTLKIDAGCLLFDEEGILLGCSDVARTLTLSDAGSDLYALFRQAVRRTLIPAAAPGQTGDALHAKAASAIWAECETARGNPLFVALESPHHDYDRDVGHLLGKNNLAHLRLACGDDQPLREGMVLCCEYQWPLKGHAIAYEDTCLVTPAGGINLTSDDE